MSQNMRFETTDIYRHSFLGDQPKGWTKAKGRTKEEDEAGNSSKTAPRNLVLFL